MDYDKQIPEQKTIYRFLRNLFTAQQLTAECAIVTLVCVIFLLVRIDRTLLLFVGF